jgi:hypothetical protein
LASRAPRPLDANECITPFLCWAKKAPALNTAASIMNGTFSQSSFIQGKV